MKAIVSLFCFFCLLNSFAQSDKLYTKTGDELVGEIKSMSRGVLVFDTDYADSDFEIEWDEIVGVNAPRTFLIYTSSGYRYKGSIKLVPDSVGVGRIETIDQQFVVPLNTIVEINALEKSFIDRLIVSVDAGLSLTKANNIRQTSASAKASYRGVKWYLSANFSNVGTIQDDVDPIDRTEGGLNIIRDVWGNSMLMTGAEFLSNSEQMLDLRSTIRTGYGYYIIRTNRIYFQAGAGLAFSRENYGGEDATNQSSIEGLGLTDFNAYDIGDLTFQAKLTTYPSITEWGRWRIDLDASVKYDLPLDFYIKLSYVHNFDSKPLIDVSKNDYVFKTSLGWEWD